MRGILFGGGHMALPKEGDNGEDQRRERAFYSEEGRGRLRCDCWMDGMKSLIRGGDTNT